MKMINIICKLNSNDSFCIEQEALVVNLTNKHNYHYNFGDTAKNLNLLRLPNHFSSEGLDLLYVSLFVYYADRIIQRDGYSDAKQEFVTFNQQLTIFLKKGYTQNANIN